MTQETTILSSAFMVRPDFAFFDDSEQANAMASPRCLLRQRRRCSGTVLFGVQLVANVLEDLGDRLGSNAIIGIMAHEYAHIAQFNYGIVSNWVRNVELHADALAGWYVGAKHRMGVNMTPEGVFRKMYDIGDMLFTSPGHHGTPQERLTATMMGYRLGTSGASVGDASNVARREIGF